MSILDYYKYAQLATAAYVRAGALAPGSDTYYKDFARLSNDQSDGRLPSSLGTDLFNPANPAAQRWTIAHYHAGDTGLTPDDTGLGATLFRNGDENVLAIRGVELPVDLFSFDEADPLQDLFGASIGGIGMLGVALTQLVELTNLIERLYKSEDGSSTVKQVRARFSAEIPQGGNLEFLTLNGGVGPLPGPPVYLEEPKWSGLVYCIKVLVQRVGDTFRVSRTLFQSCDRMTQCRDIPMEELRDLSECRSPAFQRKPAYYRTRACRRTRLAAFTQLRFGKRRTRAHLRHDRAQRWAPCRLGRLGQDLVHKVRLADDPAIERAAVEAL